MIPFAEVGFFFQRKLYVAHVSPDLDEFGFGTRDVCVYEVKGGEFKFVGAGVWGRLFRRVRLVDGTSLDLPLEHEVDRVLRRSR